MGACMFLVLLKNAPCLVVGGQACRHRTRTRAIRQALCTFELGRMVQMKQWRRGKIVGGGEVARGGEVAGGGEVARGGEGVRCSSRA